jgi:hypothetical protein
LHSSPAHRPVHRTKEPQMYIGAGALVVILIIILLIILL